MWWCIQFQFIRGLLLVWWKWDLSLHFHLLQQLFTSCRFPARFRWKFILDRMWMRIFPGDEREKQLETSSYANLYQLMQFLYYAIYNPRKLKTLKCIYRNWKTFITDFIYKAVFFTILSFKLQTPIKVAQNNPMKLKFKTKKKSTTRTPTSIWNWMHTNPLI